MSCRDKDFWADVLAGWTHHTYIVDGIPEPSLRRILSKHHTVIEAWVNGAEVEVSPPIGRSGNWVVTANPEFLPGLNYRVKPPEEYDMEQYSKAFWGTCLKMGNMHLSPAIAQALSYNRDEIVNWVNGEAVEYLDNDQWVPVPKEHHRFTSKQYRKAPPKLKQCDVVVFYRDAMPVGGRVGAVFTMPAGIDVDRLPVEPTSKHAPTLASLRAKTPGFKLLSITRVAVDDNNNLMEHSTKLDNLGRVPF